MEGSMVTAPQDSTEFSALAAERARIADDLVKHIQQTLGETGASQILAEASQYVLSVMGKLLRPLLMLEAARAGGGNPELALPAALGTEYGHVASLVHDDIIDGDTERRGQATLHSRFDLGSAILTGDMFIFHTFLNFTECQDVGVSPERVLAAIRLLSTTCIEMCQGQALETEMMGNLDTTIEQYLEMIRLKTASFCSAAAHIGALLGGADEAAVEALGGFGQSLGMTFQIVDDTLPYISDELLVGKPKGSDIQNRRVTLPIIYALRSGHELARREIEDVFERPRDLEQDYRRIRVVLVRTRALDRTRALAFHYTSSAKRHLDRLPASPSRERLRALADSLVARSY
jgi:geranylgeranyl diphosphate synthase type I